MVAIERLDGWWSRVGRQVRSESCLYILECSDIVRVPASVGLHSERAAGGERQSVLKFRIVCKELVFIHNLGAPGNKILFRQRINRFE